MRKLFTFMSLLGVVAFLAACSAGPSYTFTINGELIAVEPPPSEETEADAATTDETDETTDAAEEEVEEPVDWATATVSVTHDAEGENGEAGIVELASADLVDGKFEITGKIKEATEVTITASVGEEELTTTTMLVPNGAEISMVLVDDKNEYPRDRLYVLGTSGQSQDPSQKFTISGDLSNLEQDVSMYEFGAFGRKFEDGKMVSASFGSVMLEDGKFLLEADVSDAQVVSIYLSSPYTRDFNEYVYANAQIIAEPNASYEVEFRATGHLFITSGDGKHAELIESWKQSGEYQSTFDAYEESYLAYMAEQEAKREAAEQAAATEEEATPLESEAVSGTEPDTDTDTETDSALVKQTTEESDEPQVAGMEPAEGCEHVVIDQPHQSMAERFFSDEPNEDDPEHIVLVRKLTQIQETALQNFLNDWDNPINVLLSMELGAISTYAENREDKFPIYDKLAELLDPEIVAQRVTPARASLVAVITREENDSTLLQGQKVPEFTLANAEGEDVVLYDVLAEREVTLIDFWASWCGPCIASFPDLKRLYAAYSDHGFEIIGVSIDDNYDDWNNAAIEQELPWIDVGELKDWEGPVAVSYGVGFIPKAFLVDPNGCVLKKNVRPDMLEEALVQRFGEIPEVEANAAEQDSDAVDSGTDEMGG